MKKNSQQIAIARKLRREQTEAERVLWSRLRSKQLEGIKFRRQQPVGPYIVDFVSLERKLVVELDGGQHNEEQAKFRDSERTAWLHDNGYQVLRFWNNDILTNLDGALEKIRDLLSAPSP